MEQMIIDTSTLKLPKRLGKKIKTDQVIIRDVSEGLLLTPLPTQSRRLRGMLKNTGFSTERYFAQKCADKDLEG